MPRRGQVAKRDVLPDPLYNSKLVTKLINNIMYDGKKGVAQKIVYGAFDIIAEKTGNNPLEVFEQAMENVMPVLEVKGKGTPCRRCHISGSYGSSSRKKKNFRSEMDYSVRKTEKRKDNEGKTCRRNP